MTNSDYDLESGKGSSTGVWLGLAMMLVLVAGSAFSVLAYQQNDVSLFEAVAAGFAGVGAVIVGLFAGAVGLFLGLVGAVIGIVAAGGALAVTAFLVGSPVIAIILFVLLMRRDKGCPDPNAHGDF